MGNADADHASSEKKIRDAIDSERERYVDKRREQAGIPGDSRGTWGLALSGGGIRSATFCLGLVRGLAKNGVLKEFDYLSTVSGGGYLGASLGRLYGKQDGAKEVEAGVGRDNSMWLWWLRNNGRYLTPAGAKDRGFAAASIVRGIIATHLEIGVLILLVAGIVLLPHVLVSLDPPRQFAFWRGQAQDIAFEHGWWSLEFTSLFGSLWWWLLVIPVFLFVHQLVGYWYTRDKRSALSFLVITLAAILGILAARELFGAGHALYQSSFNGLDAGSTQKIVLSFIAGIFLLAPATAWIATGIDWIRNKPTTELRLSRTKKLSFTMWAAAIISGIALLDMVAWWLTAKFWESGSGQFPIGKTALLGIALAVARLALPEIQKRMATSKTPSLNTEKMLNVLGMALAIATLVFWTTAFSIAMFPESAWAARAPVANPPWQLPEVMTWCIVMALAFAYALLTCQSFELLNLASLHNFYRARIERAYVSSGNAHDPKARFPHGAISAATGDRTKKVAPLMEAIGGDDIELTQYRPHEHGGPIHLVNCCINQSIDDRTGIYNADRKGVSLAVSSLGVELGTAFASKVDYDQAPGKLSRWIAVSGAAASTGMGSRTSPGFAALLFMSGIRLGYWTRALVDQRSGLRKGHGWLRQWAGRFTPKPLAIVAESLARFPGQFGSVWYLSDGGHFDNTGIYALLKRRPRLIVAADCGADPKYLFSDLESLVRKAKIDYGATIEFVDPHQATDKVSPELRCALGTPETITPEAGSRWLVVGRICYADGTGGTLVVVKPRRLDQMPFDIVAYADRSPEFPQQTTGDQFFDESQWEAYHQLGVLMGRRVSKTLLKNAMAAVDDMTNAPSSLVTAEANNADAQDPRQSRRSRVGLTVGASVGAGISVSLILAIWQGFEQYRETQRLEDNQYALDYQNLRKDYGNPETLLSMGPNEIRTVADSYKQRGDDWFKNLVSLVNTTCDKVKDNADQQAKCFELLSVMQAEPPVERDYWFADRPRIPDEYDREKVGVATVQVAVVRDMAPAPTSAPAPAPVQPAGAVEVPETPLPDASDAMAAAGGAAAPVLATVQPAPGPAGAMDDSEACKASGFIQPRAYIQIYDETSRVVANALARTLSDDLGMKLPAIENVVRTSERAGRTPPYTWSTPAIIVHSGVSAACTNAIKRRMKGDDIVARPLPATFKSNPGMVEIWIPPAE